LFTQQGFFVLDFLKESVIILRAEKR